ncbi:hypothetical protein BaRGS_00039979 [Batillaria attramentaria]|uniref:Proteasome inhibitor PI31 subunit n=1 Tax=Batillaria attramentaria TaxID=370345 RepID=A0ABD0J1V3_9CAEN
MALPGFELLFSSIQPQLRSPQDAVVSAVHWGVISAGFKCIGAGENPPRGQGTETLPNGWNSGDIYDLHYEESKTHRAYTLKIIPVDGSLMIHFQKENSENVSTLDIQVRDYATDNFTSVSSALPGLDRLNVQIHDSLMKPATGGQRQGGDNSPASSSSSPPSQQKDKKSSLLVEEGRGIPQPNPFQPVWGGSPTHINPFSVGRSDLDPLAGMGVGSGTGGGMIMDPRYSGGPRFGNEPGFGSFGPVRGGGIHPSALPPGAVPPGARFDPIGPPGTRPNPDPDHARPPDYDDMFM